MNKEKVFCLISSLSVIILMSLVERFLAPVYLVKSLIKIVLFHLPILMHCFLFKNNYSDLVNFRIIKPSKKLILSMILVYLFIIASFLVFKDQIDLSLIREKLFAKEGLSEDNFIFIFSYIILCNSYLEESFFRGYISSTLEDKKGKLISAVLFSLYHIAIMSGWFSFFIFILLILGLSASALVLQYIADKEGSILSSWLVHGFANLAINTIGTIMILS